jgi:uncharacterized membrane protein YbaN (DUF454 family)
VNGLNRCSILSSELVPFFREIVFPLWFGHLGCRRSDTVELDGPHETPLALELAGHSGRGAAFLCLDIEIDEKAGRVRVHDPRLFRAGQHSFCKRLLAAASEQREIRRAEVNLTTATCWLEFGPGLETSQALASAFIQAVRQATAGNRNKAKRSLWQRLTGSFRWNRSRRSNGSVCWEALELEPGRIAIDVRGLTGDQDQISRLTDSLTGLEAVEVCHILPWSGRIAVRFRPERSGLDHLLDGVERALAGIQGDRPKFSFSRAKADNRARSLPSPNEWLERVPGFGPLVREWDEYGCLSLSSKGKLIGLSLALTITLVIFLPPSPSMWIMLALLSATMVIGIARMPSIADELRSRVQINRRTWLALPSA